MLLKGDCRFFGAACLCCRNMNKKEKPKNEIQETPRERVFWVTFCGLSVFLYILGGSRINAIVRMVSEGEGKPGNVTTSPQMKFIL